MKELIETIKNTNHLNLEFETWIQENTTQEQQKNIDDLNCMQNLKRVYEGKYWANLHAYQIKIVEKIKQWKHNVLKKEDALKGGILSCEMGLGKTVMSLSFLEWNRGKMNMILCDKSTITTWVNEIKKHYNGILNFIILHSSYINGADTITIQTLKELKVDVVIVTFEYLISKFDLKKKCLKVRKKNCRSMMPDLYSYDEISKMKEANRCVVEGAVKIKNTQPKKFESLYDIEWDLIIMDETTRIMKMTSNASISATALFSKFFLVLSGTPILNYAKDLCSIFQFLGCPFMRSKEWNKNVFEELNLDQHMLRLSYDDVDDENQKFKKPPKPNFVTSVLELDKDQYFIQREICEMFESSGKNKNTLSLFVYSLKMCISKTLMNIDLVHLLVEFKKTKMNWNDQFFTLMEDDGDELMLDYDSDETVIDDEKEIFESHMSNIQKLNAYAGVLKSFFQNELKSKDSPKYKKCLEICLSRKDKGIVVFSKYAEPLQQLQTIIEKESDLNVGFINGKTKSRQRSLIIEQCNQNKIHVLLMTYDIGACSLNISGMQTIVLLDSAYNVSTESQAIARCYRMGQLGVVDVHILVMKNTFEQHILQLQQKKEDDKNNFMGETDFIKKRTKMDQTVFGDYVKHFLNQTKSFESKNNDVVK